MVIEEFNLSLIVSRSKDNQHTCFAPNPLKNKNKNKKTKNQIGFESLFLAHAGSQN